MAKLLVLLGPTGVGKTELSLRLAEHFDCPIINADSRQIYRDLPIGTAAPTADELLRVRHYMVGTHALDETYNAGQFARDAWKIIDSLPSGREGEESPTAILSGGSMMYLDAVCNGLDDIPDVPTEIRAELNREYEEKGLIWLQSEVERLDPAYWQTVDRQNPQRLLHCLEVTRAANKPYSVFRGDITPATTERSLLRGEEGTEIVKIGLTRPREELYDRINRRVIQMMTDGLEDEARRAYGRLTAPTVGYREMFDFFDGKITRDEAVRLIQQNSRHYAKRQLTWWRRDSSIHWIDATDDYETILHTVEHLVGTGGLQEEHH